LTLAADRYTATDAASIPTGELAAVDGTPFDFRKATPIGARIAEAHARLESNDTAGKLVIELPPR
ncbi:MAG TPA: hypothetical protein PLX31_16460, partial [Gemmatimonadaceae bacterium]|nr:hypothetical protein [Gemmatimonadaceae bacterium]